MPLSIFGNVTDHATWQPDPNGRGTSGILQQCLITVGLSIHSAIHLNIPVHKSSDWAKIRLKVTWLFCALLAPEWIVYLAWAQRREAKEIAWALNKATGRANPPETKIRRSLNRLRKRRRKGNNPEDAVKEESTSELQGPAVTGVQGQSSLVGDSFTSTRQKTSEEKTHSDEAEEPFSLVHGFFFLMGGLAFDNAKDPVKFWPEGVERLMLAPGFILWCINNGYQDIIPRITVQDIKDKSKANRLAKGLTCIQAVWFCLQFITRLAQALPISLLELNTFAHAICAILIYSLWWNKPFDIEKPILIPTGSSERLRALSAKAASHSAISSRARINLEKLQRFTGYEQKADIWSFFVLWLNRLVTEMFSFRMLHTRPLYCPHHTRPPWYWDTQVRLFESDFFETETATTKFQDIINSPILYAIPTGALRARGKFLCQPQKLKQVKYPNRFDGISSSLEDFVFVSESPPVILLKPGDTVPGTNLMMGTQVATIYCELDERALRRIQLGTKVVENFNDFSQCPETDFDYGCLIFDQPNRALIRKINGREKVTIGQLDLPAFFAILLSSFLYGGLHGLAFGIPFHSTAESILWSISCLTVASAGILFLIYCLIFQPIILTLDWIRRGSVWKYLKRKYRGLNETLKLVVEVFAILTFGTALLGGSTLLYIFSRVYLVVEVFLNLPYVDPGVYQTPNWSIYWPHIT